MNIEEWWFLPVWRLSNSLCSTKNNNLLKQFLRKHNLWHSGYATFMTYLSLFQLLYLQFFFKVNYSHRSFVILKKEFAQLN